MSCPLLEYVFAQVATYTPPFPLEVGLDIQGFGIIVEGSMPTLSGTGQLLYTPAHWVTFSHSLFRFFVPPSFRGTLACEATFQNPGGPQSYPEDVTVQIAPPYWGSSSYSISIETAADAKLSINGTFVPDCNLYIWGKGSGSLTGFIPETPIEMWLRFPPHPL